VCVEKLEKCCYATGSDWVNWESTIFFVSEELLKMQAASISAVVASAPCNLYHWGEG